MRDAPINAPSQGEFDLPADSVWRWYDVFDAPFPLGIRDRIGRVHARTLREAEQLAAKQFGRLKTLVVSLARGRRQRRHP